MFGDRDILRFFSLVSSVFAIVDKAPTTPNTSSNVSDLIKEIRKIDGKLNIISRLVGMSTAINYTGIEGSAKDNYFLLRLDYTNKDLQVNSFSEGKVNLATDIYNAIEKNNDPDIDVVLVSATSFDSLRIAYPNYFTDITEFIGMVNVIMDIALD